MLRDCARGFWDLGLLGFSGLENHFRLAFSRVCPVPAEQTRASQLPQPATSWLSPSSWLGKQKEVEVNASAFVCDNHSSVAQRLAAPSPQLPFHDVANLLIGFVLLDMSVSVLMCVCVCLSVCVSMSVCVCVCV